MRRGRVAKAAGLRAEGIAAEAASAAIAAAEDTAAVTRVAVAAKERAEAADATGFPTRITANPYASRANRAGNGSASSHSNTRAKATPRAGSFASKDVLRFAAAENGWLQFP